jgi:hypothetical protein
MGVYEQMIQAKADKLNFRAAFVSGVAGKFGISGASEGSLSKALNGAKELPTQTAFELDQLLTRIVKMADALAPFKVRFDDSDEVKTLLEGFESGNIVVTVQRFEIHTITPFYVVLVNGQLFERMNDGNPILTSKETECAAFKTRESAHTVAKLLDGMGLSGIRTTSITNIRRDPSTIHDQVSAFGFTQETANSK